MPTVKMPDGSTAQFPDGMSPQDMQGVIEQHLAQQSSAPPDMAQVAGATPGTSAPVAHVPTPAGLQGTAAPGLRGNWHSNTDELPNPGNSMLTGAENFVRGAGSGIGSLVMHPLNAVQGMGDSLVAGGSTPYGTPLFAPTGNQKIDADNQQAQGEAQARQATMAQQMVAHPAYSAGQLAGPLLLGKGIAGVTPPALEAIGSSGEHLQNFAADRLNSRMNVGPKDMAYGQNPGAGMLRSGIGISTRSGLVNKVEGALDANGQMLSKVVSRADANANAPQITPQQLRPFIDNPINSKMNVVGGIGNHVADAEAPLRVLQQKATLPAPGATAPIYGPNAPQTILPSDLWKSIQNIDANTRFNPQPEIETVNEVGRDIRGGLRGQLETVDPSIKPISQNYSDLRSAQTALDRQGSPFYAPTGLKSLIAATVNSYPVRTALSSGLYGVGGAMKRLGGASIGPPAVPFSQKMGVPPLQLEANVPGNSPYGNDFSAGRIPPRNPITPAVPRTYAALPVNASGGEAQPMIGVKSTAPPSVLNDYAKTRIVPTKGELTRMGGTTLPPETNGLSLPAGLQRFSLPSSVTGGPVEPMIWEKGNPYPTLAEDYAKTRIDPTKFNGPPDNPLGQLKGFLNAKNPTRKGPAGR